MGARCRNGQLWPKLKSRKSHNQANFMNLQKEYTLADLISNLATICLISRIYIILKMLEVKLNPTAIVFNFLNLPLKRTPPVDAHPYSLTRVTAYGLQSTEMDEKKSDAI